MFYFYHCYHIFSNDHALMNMVLFSATSLEKNGANFVSGQLYLKWKGLCVFTFAFFFAISEISKK